MDYVYAAIGLVLLLVAGDLLVRGAVNMSLRLGVPALIVGLTIVAFGTSAPELLISISAILEGSPGIAMGNVVGSNTANILMVLGVPALLAGGIHTGTVDTRKSYAIMIGATVIFIAMAYLGGFNWAYGLVLLAMLAVILGGQAREAMRHRRDAQDEAEEEEELEGVDPSMPWWKINTFLVLGLIGLPLGAEVLVNAAQAIARDFGVSDAVIGLTLVAVGTSLPELATTMAAAWRKQTEVALGNVIGSNMFNLLAIIGVASLFGAIPVDPQILRFDLWVMLAASLVLAPFVFIKSASIGKLWGAAFCVLYGVYVWQVVV
ncbi:MAG: calcium/sodium antiporter [Pseudomonadota bacterium]